MHTHGASICVLTLNKLEVTEHMLRSLLKTDFPADCELILVDNGSVDGTPERLLQFQRTHGCDRLHVTVVLNDRNLGCPGGRNQAATLASKAFLVFVDNDLEFHDPRWLSEGLACLSGSRNIGVLGGKLIYADDPRRLQSAGVELDALANVEYLGEGEPPDSPPHNVPREVQGVAGACFFVETALFRNTGAFDEDFSPGNYEDLDFCYRVRQRGLQVLYAPTVAVLHRAHSTTHHMPELSIRRVNIRNQRLFRERWASILQAEAASRKFEGKSHGTASPQEAGAR